MIRQRPWAVVLAMLLAVSGQVSAQATKPPELPPGTKAQRDIAYVKDGHERQKLDLYLPEKAGGPLPVVVWIHGGGWQAGNKDNPPAVWLTTKGYAVASINYRLSQHAVFPAQIEDCKAAIRWLRANAKQYNLDPDHIGVWGASAGGHLVALLGTGATVKELEGKLGNNEQSSKVQCVVDWFGPTDFSAFGDAVNKENSMVYKLLGCAPKDNKDKVALVSPVTHVTKEAAPFLIMHGDKDPLVPFSQSEILRDSLKKAGVEVTLHKLEGAGHGGKEFRTDEVRKEIEEFLDKHLKKAKK